MSETLPAYDRDNFPYAGLFEDLTQEIQEGSMLPVEAYVRYTNMREEQQLGPQFDYLGTENSMIGVARSVAQQLSHEGTLASHELVLPVDLGNVGWVRSDRVAFRGLVLAGADLRPLAQRIGYSGFERQLARAERGWGVQLDVMNDVTQSPLTQRVQYDRFATSLSNTLLATDAVRVPARSLISLGEPELSVDCWTEWRMAQRLGIPTKHAVSSTGSWKISHINYTAGRRPA